MLSGENSILKQAGTAKEQTLIAQEKENVELVYPTQKIYSKNILIGN